MKQRKGALRCNRGFLDSWMSTWKFRCRIPQSKSPLSQWLQVFILPIERMTFMNLRRWILERKLLHIHRWTLRRGSRAFYSNRGSQEAGSWQTASLGDFQRTMAESRVKHWKVSWSVQSAHPQGRVPLGLGHVSHVAFRRGAHLGA